MSKRARMSDVGETTMLMDLPMEILFEILTRLPIKSIACMRCVSKTLSDDIIDSPLFAKATPPHFMRFNPNGPELCFESMNYYSSNQGKVLSVSESVCLAVPQPDTSVLHFVFYDWVCFSNWNVNGSAFLANPLRGEVMKLPKVNLTDIRSLRVAYGMCHDDMKSTYKIVRLSEFSVKKTKTLAYKNVRLLAHILVDGGVDTLINSWKELPIPSEISCHPFSCEKLSVCAYGNTHWLCENGNGGGYILCFDFVKEEFSSIRNLGKSSSSINGLNLITYKGALTIVDTSGINIEIWVMQNYNKRQWAKEYTITLEANVMRNYIYGRCWEWEHGIFFPTNSTGWKKSLFLDLERAPIKPDLVENYTKSPIWWPTTLSLQRSLISLKQIGRIGERITTRSRLQVA